MTTAVGSSAAKANEHRETEVKKKKTAPKSPTKTEKQKRHEIREAAAETQSIISGKQWNIGAIRTERFSEEETYAAIVLKRLNNHYPEVAIQMKAELGASIEDARGKGAPKAIASGVNAVLKRAVAEGKMTEEQMLSTVGLAIGKAQLGSPEGETGVGSIDATEEASIVGRTGRARKNNLENMVDRVRANQRLSPEVASLFLQSTSLHEINTQPPGTTINGSSGPVPQPTSTAAKQDPRYESVWYKDGTIITGADTHLYIPGDQNGTPRFYLSATHVDQYTKVVFYDIEADEAIDLKLLGKGSDGRSEWGFPEGFAAEHHIGSLHAFDPTGGTVRLGYIDSTRPWLNEIH